MDKKYIELFEGIAQAVEISAEQVMEYDHEKNDEQGEKTAEILRNDFHEMHDHIKNNGDSYIPTKHDVALLLVGSYIVANQVQDRIINLKEALRGYQTDIIPKLQDIMNNTSNDEEAAKLAEEKFIIKPNETNT